MDKFENTLKEMYSRLGHMLNEEDMAPIPDAGGGSALPGGDMSNPFDNALPDSGASDENQLDNKQKRETDPREYTRSVLSLLTNNEEGVSPEMFNDFIDSVSLSITKLRNKDEIKKFYNEFYNKIIHVLEIGEETKEMFKQLSDIIKDVVGAEYEPDNAGGGAGMSGPSGPGVN